MGASNTPEASAVGHTLGPWEVWDSLYVGMGAAVVRAGSDPLETVAEVRDFRNARLIAAAPDGYELARKVVEASELSGGRGPLRDLADVVIAKAEGAS